MPRSTPTVALLAAVLTFHGFAQTAQAQPTFTISTIAGTGTAGTSGDGGPASSANLNGPYGVALDAAGNIYIADTSANRVRKVTPDGTITTFAGTGDPAFGGDGGPAANAFLSSPLRLAFDAAGNLYITDSSNPRIRKVTPDGTISTVAGNGKAGYSGDGGPAVNASISGPADAVPDAAGNLYIVDQGNQVIRKVDTNGIITTVVGMGRPGFSGDGGPGTSALLNGPAAIAFNTAGDLFIADQNNNRIRKLSGGIITTIAGTGAAGFSGDGGLATNAMVNFVVGLAFDGTGNLYFSETQNSRVRVLLANGTVQTVAGNGKNGFSGDGGAATGGELFNPRSLATFAGNVYIADTNNQRIRALTPASAAPVITQVVSPSAFGGSAAIAPGSWIEIHGTNLAKDDYAVHDPEVEHKLTRAIHDYFFAKSLEKVRPGGVMALITSRYTMDKQDATIRRHLAQHADLLGAIRLPNTAFKENAGTEVTTDIIFLQKRLPGKAPAGQAWSELVNVGTVSPPGGNADINEYYANHPYMMLGSLNLEGTMYRGAEPMLAGRLTPELLARAIAELPGGVYIPKDEGRGPPLKVLDAEAFTGIKDGAYAEQGGAIVIRSGNGFEPTSLSATTAARVRGMMAVRDAVRLVFKTQLEDAPHDQIIEARKLLGGLYDSFVWRYGPLTARDNLRAFAADPDQALLLSLENYDAETKHATKTAIFTQRTLERYRPRDHVETAAEALAISLNETGGIDWKRMAGLTGHSVRQMQQELDNLVYRNPEGDWETADRYLSGNVRTKLKTAQAAAGIDPSYQRNADALKAVQPADLLPGDISARLGSSWIPASDIRDFICETLDMPKSFVRVSHSGAIATWALTLDSNAKSSVSNTTTHGTPRALASNLIEDALNGRTPTIYDQIDKDTRVVNQQETIAAREAQQKLKDRFAEWIWQDEERAHRLARHYNDTFNHIRLRSYDGSHLTFPGMNRSMLRKNDLDKHQKDAVWRMLQNDHTLLAHCVGAGKTFEMVAAAMEMRRLGLAAKPMIVVPNHLVEQWGAAFLALYPQAQLFVAGREAFAAGNRQKAMSRIATGNYDAVIVSHKSFELLPVSDETFQRFIGKQIEQLENAVYEARAETGDNRRIVKELEKAKKRLVTKLKERADRERKDDAVTFEQLGIDRLFVDEADLFKNLGFVSKMNRIAGLPNTESNRALDMYMKTRYLAERSGGTVFATGTPVSNTMAEMYTLQRYLAPELLSAAGVEHFDAWAANFGEAVTALELAPDGSGYRMHTRFAKFVNLPELLSMFRSFADVQTADTLHLPRPEIDGGKPHIAAAPASPELKEYVQTLVDRAQKLRTSKIDPSLDNMLKITGDGRKAALDMRLVDPFAEIHGDTKVSRAVESIYRTWQERGDTRSTQLVFCDLSTPNPDKFNVYDEIRDRLIAKGIPAKEIAYIHNADTDIQKKTLFDSVNAGRIRILLGSTEKMGAGTNVQKRHVALHHLDAPWRPRDIEQREGRILRQGNDNPIVHVHRYVTEGSFDAYMWQCLETKARFIQQVMNGSVTVRQAEDLEGGALTFAEIKAIASGNPAVMEKVKVDTEIRKLDQLRASHINQQHNIRWQVKSLPEQIDSARKYHAAVSADILTRDSHADEDFTMKVGNRDIRGKAAREEAGNALNSVVMSWRNDRTLQVRAHFKGFEILSRGSAFKDGEPELFIRGKETYKANLNPENPLGTIASIEHVLRSLDRRAEQEQQEIERHEKALADYKAQLGRPFEHESHLKDLLAKQAELNASLDLDKHEAQVVEEPREPEEEKTVPAGFAARVRAEDRGVAMAP